MKIFKEILIRIVEAIIYLLTFAAHMYVMTLLYTDLGHIPSIPECFLCMGLFIIIALMEDHIFQTARRKRKEGN